MIQEHTLKTLPAYYDAVASGDKPFEVRRDDRGYQKGDILVLQRLRQDGRVECEYNGTVKYELRKRITYVLTGGQFGIEPGYVVLGIENETPDLSR